MMTEMHRSAQHDKHPNQSLVNSYHPHIKFDYAIITKHYQEMTYMHISR
jgi:hypothetical protein